MRDRDFHLARTADAAERLRRDHPGRVTLLAGCEATIFTPGIVKGRSFQRRIARLQAGGLDRAAIRRRLNAHLGKAAAVARARFDGPVGYAAVGFEPVDWRPFDVVGVDHYRFHATPAEHARELEAFRAAGKPLLICEFGCCTHRGAARSGGMGWAIVDWSAARPAVPAEVVRSEQEQAEHVAALLGVFESMHLLGACVHTFAEPGKPHARLSRDDPRHRLLRRREADPHDLDDPASPYLAAIGEST